MFQIIGGPKGLEVSITVDTTNVALRATWAPSAPGLKPPVASMYYPIEDIKRGNNYGSALQRMAAHVAKATDVPTELRPL